MCRPQEGRAAFVLLSERERARESGDGRMLVRVGGWVGGRGQKVTLKL